MTNMQSSPGIWSFANPIRFRSKKKAGYADWNVPDAVQGTAYHKAVEVYLSSSGCSSSVAHNLHLILSRHMLPPAATPEHLLLREFSQSVKLISDKENLSDNTAFQKQFLALNVVTSALQKLPHYFSQDELIRLGKILDSTPTFKKGVAISRDSLKDAFPEHFKDDEIAHKAVREFCFDFLERWQSIRKQIKTQYATERKAIIFEIESAAKADSRVLSAEHGIGVLTKFNQTVWKNGPPSFLRLAVQPLMTAIAQGLGRKDLKEFMVASHITQGSGISSRKRGFKPCPEDIEELLEFMYLKLEVPPRRNGVAGTISPLSFVGPVTRMELSIIALLLNSDRIETSGVRNLQFDDFDFVGTLRSKLRIAPEKTRQGRKEASIYNRGDRFYNVMKGFYDELKALENESSVIFQGIVGNSSLLTRAFKRDEFASGTIFKFTSEASQLTAYLVSGLSVAKSMSGNPFIQLLKSWCNVANRSNASRFKSYNVSNSAVRADTPLLTGSVRLSEDMQARHSEEAYSDYEWMAIRHRHSLATRLNSYHVPEKDLKMADDLKRFEIGVGNEQLKIVMELASFTANSTELLSESEMKDRLGITSKAVKLEAEKLLQSEELLGHVVNSDISVVASQEGFIVIESPIIAFFIQQKIEHIEKNIADLHVSNPELARRFVAFYAYLQLLLKRFSEKTKHQAKQRYGNKQLQFGPLTISGDDL